MASGRVERTMGPNGEERVRLHHPCGSSAEVGAREEERAAAAELRQQVCVGGWVFFFCTVCLRVPLWLGCGVGGA